MSSITGIDDKYFENYIPLAIPMLPPLGNPKSSFNIDKTPKPVSAEDYMKSELDAVSTNKTNYDEEVFSTSIDAVKRYNDPLIEYKPGHDMEDIYASAHPFTWGDSAKKFAYTFKNHIGSSFQMAGSMIASAARGESMLDSNFSEHMAMVTENLELEIPQYKTAYERENPFALDNFFDSTLKSILPSAGTALGGMADMLIGHAIATALTPFTGGASGTVGNAALLAKDAAVIRNIFGAGYSIAKVLNTAKNVKNIGSATQMLITSAFYANSEAALQAKMNENSFVENEKSKYYKLHGVMPTGKDLEKLQANGAALSRETYGMNLALISMSSMVQFPSLLNGKFASNISKNLPITFDKAGLAVRGSFTKKGIRDFAESATSEGFEEFFQGVIDNSTTDYYSGQKNKSRSHSYIAGIGSKLNQEGLLEFVGGAIIGGGMSGMGSIGSAIKGAESAIVDKHIAAYNSSSTALTKSFIDSEINLNAMSEAIEAKDNIKLDNALVSEIYNTARTSYNNSTLQPRRDFLVDLKNMPLAEFNKFMGNKFTQEQQHAYIDESLKQFNTAASILEGTDALYQVNPLINESRYEKIIGELPLFGDATRHEQEAEIWSEFKDEFAKSVFKEVELGVRIQDKLQPFKETYGEDIDNIISPDIPKAISNYKSKLKSQLVIDPTNQSKLDKLEGKSEAEQYELILKDLGVIGEEAFADIEEIIKLKAIEQTLFKKNNILRTKTGQIAEVEKLAAYFEYRKTPDKSTEVIETATSGSTITKDGDTFIVKDVDGKELLRTEDEAEAKLKVVESNGPPVVPDTQDDSGNPVTTTPEANEAQEPVETQENIQPLLDERLKLAMQTGNAPVDLVMQMLEKEITKVPYTKLEQEFVKQFEGAINEMRKTFKGNPAKSVDGTYNPKPGNLFITGSIVGSRFRIEGGRIFIHGIDMNNLDDITDIEITDNPKEISKEDVIKLIEQQPDNRVIKQIFKDNFKLDSAQTKLSDIDRYIKEKKLSLEEQNKLNTLIQNNLITIEC